MKNKLDELNERLTSLESTWNKLSSKSIPLQLSELDLKEILLWKELAEHGGLVPRAVLVKTLEEAMRVVGEKNNG